jgi:transposase InsO family protein
MLDFLSLLIHALAAPLRTQARLEAEIIMLRHQLNVLRRQTPRPRLTAADRLLFVWLCRLFPSLRNAITIVQPDTVLRWHRSGFRLYWQWKSRSRGGRPKVPIEVRTLIWRMSVENPLWGAARIHGELLKLGIEVAQSTVAKYMAKSRTGGSGQTWKTFLRNHAAGIGAMDFLVVPTINFRLLSVLVILRHERRRLISLRVTDHPTAEWIARQVTEAFPWDEAPTDLIRDRDARYGHAVRRRLVAMGIRDHPIAPHSPWQNGHAERLIGSIRRECLDHVVILGESHLRRVLMAYAAYYNHVRPHLALAKDAPLVRPVLRFGQVTARPILGGLHHQYCRT